MNKILISGGSGLVGKHLTTKLIEKGYQVAWLSRNPSKNPQVKIFQWDVTQGTIDAQALDFADAIVHLAGAGIADKSWSKKRKQEIVDSRVKSAELIVEQLKKHKKSPKVLVAASAIGYYGAVNSDQTFVETDPPASDFLGTTTQQWEKSTNDFRELGIPTVQFRLGVVLSKKGGALNKMALPVKYGLGAPVGSGKQIVPWIHVDDLCEMFIMAIDERLPEGIYNAVAPVKDTNRKFMKTLAEVMNKPFFLPPVPGFLLKFSIGEMADMVLKGSAISAQKIQDAGYTFQYTELKDALKNLEL